MPYPTIDLNTKKVILLSGYQWSDNSTDEEVQVVALEKLQTEMERHTDAVAFCYVSGKWVPAA
ncbi:conserved protein of unknown function [Candidatus Filomicrobium marinum]|uniref:Uncharacterized protein n=2 Tax=Filomicrobium TaxID=119044 RepID=A0A0D6JKP4_9HYPH|nr:MULTISPECIES: hypothetical protein [Filomicrobium]MCV0371318.1 hypothetical protein [Filomicrobium sp.]CFX57100.1 conserved protein of unknown function [Candidatus Filomicrobium marinum]CPR22267.1 conserved protein of unknown function [Candidatus Filomicrobium marinum]SDO90172.1 hypothetical protein SAMN04488061_1964 [Filomicrobium insigne]